MNKNFKFQILNFKLRRGFTLIELIVYMGLMSIFLLTLTEIFLSVLDVQTESQQNSSVEQDGKYILARLNYDISQASTITSPASLGQSANAATLVISGVNYTYDGSGSSLILTNNYGASQINSDGSTISNVSFSRLGNSGGKNSLQIKFRLTSSSNRNAGREMRDFQTTLGTR